MDPSELREALDALPGYSGIVAGEMNDPAEVLCALFDSLNRVPELNPAGATDQQGACACLCMLERAGRRLGVGEVRRHRGRLSHMPPLCSNYRTQNLGRQAWLVP